MHLGLILVGLAALAVAAPVDKSMAGYEPYTDYKVYYTTYDPYPASIEEEAAKMDMAKRGENSGYSPYTTYGVYYTTYTPYSAATEEEAAKMGITKRTSGSYNPYTCYGAAAEAQAAAAIAKRSDSEYSSDSKYSSYAPYACYGSYSAAAEAEAANMNADVATRSAMMKDAAFKDGEDLMKRHMMMKMPEGMDEEDASMMERRAEANL